MFKFFFEEFIQVLVMVQDDNGFEWFNIYVVWGRVYPHKKQGNLVEIYYHLLK
jgi:hypothetical protein